MNIQQLEDDARMFCDMAKSEAQIRASERVKMAVTELAMAEAFTGGIEYAGDDEGRWCRISPDERVEVEGLQDAYYDQLAREMTKWATKAMVAHDFTCLGKDQDGYDIGDMDTQELIGGEW